MEYSPNPQKWSTRECSFNVSMKHVENINIVNSENMFDEYSLLYFTHKCTCNVLMKCVYNINI